MVTPTPPSGSKTSASTASVVSKVSLWLARFKGPIVAIAGVGAVLSGLVGWYTTYKTVAGTATTQSAVALSVDAINPLSILVLPFANQTGDANKAYIADALTSSISADLNRIRDAFVVPAATAFTYKDKNLTVAQAAKDAGVRFVLQGGVVASGDKLRISAQLADTQSGKQLWNETFEGEASKLFELQDQVTTRIGNSIGNEMVIVAARESEMRKSSPKVADLMLRVRALGLKPQSTDNYQKVEVLLREVIKQEPDNAVALSALAATLTTFAENLVGETSPRYQPMFKEAKKLALRAKAIDDQLPSIYAALAAHASNIDKDSAEYKRNLELVLKLVPRSPYGYNNLAVWYYYDGQPQRAIELLNKSLALYPKGFDAIFSNLARCYLMLGDNAAAIEWAQRGADMGSTLTTVSSTLARANANLGRMDKASLYANEYRQLMVQLGRKSSIDKLDESDSPAWIKYYNEHYLPEWRKAGLPE